MTYKEFYIWLEGYLTGKLENKQIEIKELSAKDVLNKIAMEYK